MASAAEQKTDWNLGETVMWFCTRDQDRVAAMWDMSEPDAVIGVFFARTLLPGQKGTLTVVAVPDPTEPATRAVALWISELSRIEQREVPLEGAIPELMRGLQTGRIRMTMIRCDGDKVERMAVSPTAANDLEIRLTEDPLEPVLVWSRERQSPAGRSPRFSRSDVIRSWPERSKKTAAATGLILRYLQEIMTPQAPLAKHEARERCIAEVGGAYPAAFEKAWGQLERSRKRGRGKRGRAAH
jgi:hypothetical protein